MINQIILEHPAKSLILPEAWHILLRNCIKFGTFCSRIERLADKIAKAPADEPNVYYYQSGDSADNKFKGDVFEIFCEVLIKLSPIDDRIGIYDYHPFIPTEEQGDTGVDGYGKSQTGGNATVQIKYRQWDYTLTVDREHLNNFRETSFRKYKIDPRDVGKMLIITAGCETHWKTLEKAFGSKVRCISRDAAYGCLRGAQSHTIDSLFSLKTITDGNFMFWNSFKQLVGVTQ